MNLRRLSALALALLFIGSFVYAENEMQWLRGSAISIEGGSYFLGKPIAPDESSAKVEISKTTETGIHEWARWYSGTLKVPFLISGKTIVWFSSISGNDTGAEFRWALYDYSPDNSQSTQVIQSGWFPVTANGEKETSIDTPEYVFASGHRMKLLVEYRSANGGGAIKITVDEGSAGQNTVYNSSNGIAYAAAGAKNAAAIIVNAPGTGCAIACSSDAQCDDSNSLTNDSCANPGTCSSACPHQACPVACSGNSQCNDSNSLTTDLCTNSGTCSALCVNTPVSCTPLCSSNAQCDDSNALTNDVCVNPGSCNAACSNSASQCTVACFSDSQCDDSNSLTGDSCSNAGTCNAYCSNTPIIVAEAQEESQDCTIACSNDSGCDDKDISTKDSCTNAGNCSAVCKNEMCSIACYSGSDCDDGNPLTSDSCQNAGQCNAGCSNSGCVPMCKANSDCDDKDASTTDVCPGAGRCSATCVYLKKCGDGKCEAAEGETECSCQQDCGSCYLVIEGAQCREKNCVANSCRETVTLGCCGNGICELKEDYSNCAVDCRPKKVDFELLGFDEAEKRLGGEKIDFKASLVADGIKFSTADIYAEGFFGRISFANDGKHGDGIGGDNVYGNSFTIGDGNREGSYAIKFTVNVAGSQRVLVKNIIVSKKLDLSFTADKENYFLSDSIGISGSLKKKDLALDLPIRLRISIPAEYETLVDKNIMPVSGNYEFSYKTATIQKAGTWKIELYAEDGNKNSARLVKEINLLKPGSVISLGVKLKPEKEALQRGGYSDINIEVFSPSGEATDANVVLEAFGKQVNADRLGTGIYSARIYADFSVGAGKQSIKASAKKEQDGAIYSGSAVIDINVSETALNIEVLEPKGKHYLIGDAMPIKARASYADGSAVENAEIEAIVGGKKIKLYAREKGIYYGGHIVSEADRGLLKISFSVKDSYGNSIEGGNGELDVSGYSPMFYAREYGLAAALIFVFVLAAVLGARSVALKKIRIGIMRKKEKQIIEVIKGLQYQYFKEASMDKKTYDSEVNKYEAKLNDLRDNIAIAEGKIKLRK